MNSVVISPEASRHKWLEGQREILRAPQEYACLADIKPLENRIGFTAESAR